ncbi:hypothetical protein B0J17DRAFT_667334 [Rhizoctonia solani]|nr:hypothetical protein B0J17DRAFT_667334 [Rhizoctonia solani]
MGNDHYYTLDKEEAGVASSGYEYEGVECLVLADDVPELPTSPVYVYVSQGEDNHYYTTEKVIQGDLAEKRGYVAQNNGEPVFHVYTRPVTGETIPLYVWWINHNHFYTVHPSGERASWEDGVYKGILGHVYPKDTKPKGSIKPLHRYYKK